MTKNARYIAVIGDLVASRMLSTAQRGDLQERLAAFFAEIRPDTAPGLAAHPLITLGDEFQALFHADGPGIDSLLRLIPATVELVRPTAVRFGLGIGGLTTALQDQALGMDGPCFHRARAALDRARDTDLLCQIEAGDHALETLWSTLASYALRQRLAWTAPQRQAIGLYEQVGAWNKVASTLGVSAGAVSLRHQAAGWSLYRAAWSALDDGLKRAVADLDQAEETNP